VEFYPSMQTVLEVSSVPQRLLWIVSLSCSESPQEEQLWCTLLGRIQHLHHPHKQADPDDHFTIESALRSGKRDVAEPGRGRRHDREIKRPPS